ncbi:MAG: SprT family zinc-dependent metalloprotease [Synechococcus sp.]|nr:SprT family zinc-dependent metalloprotease [Synechococcus sp.]
MPLDPLPPLFHRLDREHFDGALAQLVQPELKLRWSDGRMTRTAGVYRRGPGLSEIVLSRPLLVPLPREATLSTLCHEMIHAWVDRVLRVKEVHGPQFRSRMARINASQQQFEVSLRHRYPLPAVAVPWLAVCPACGQSSPYRRRREGLACRSCCERHNGGCWDGRFSLRFERQQQVSHG